MFRITEITYDDDPEESDARFTRGLIRGMRNAARYWKMRFEPEHFKTGAVRKYDYKLRDKKYMIRKARRMKHQNPLVWTGRLRTMVLGQFPQPRVRDEGGKVTSSMSLNVPRYTFYSRTKSGSEGPRKYDELIRTNSAEVETMRGILMADIRQSLKRKVRKRVRIA